MRSKHTASKGIVGIVSRVPLPKEARTDKILVADAIPDSARELVGYSGFLTTAKLDDQIEGLPVVSSVRDVDHLRTHDIVAMEPVSGFIRTAYRPDSDHNVIFTTERCNSNCLMCSQPPQDRDDTVALTERNLEIIRLIDRAPSRLVITGGEPTLLTRRKIIYDNLRSSPLFGTNSLTHTCTCLRTVAFLRGPISRPSLRQQTTRTSCWEFRFIRTIQPRTITWYRPKVLSTKR